MSGRGALKQRPDIQPALEHLEAALEATCASMVILEAIRATRHEGVPNTRLIEAQMVNAIASLRQAIAELRRLHDTETSVLAFGFVLADPPGPVHEPDGAGSGASQCSPRRTA